MISQIFAYHGFGIDHSYWESLLPQINTDHYLIVPLRIGLCHSFGLHYLLLDHQKRPFDVIIALQAPLRFLRHPQKAYEGGIHPSIFKKMEEDLREQPQKFLRRFYHKCGLPDSYFPLQLTSKVILRLSYELGIMREMPLAQHLESIKQTPPLLVLGTLDDPIVTPAMLENSWKGYQCQMFFHETGKHILGPAAKNWCAEKINSFITKVIHEHRQSSYSSCF